MSVCRLVLVPLLVFCVSPSPLHPLLPAPVIPIVLVLIVGLTTGYLGTLAMIMAPASALQEQKELTGKGGGEVGKVRSVLPKTLCLGTSALVGSKFFSLLYLPPIALSIITLATVMNTGVLHT